MDIEEKAKGGGRVGYILMCVYVCAFVASETDKE